MAVALLGGILQDDHSESMWLEISDMLETSNFDDIITQAEVRKEDVNYHQASLKASMELRFVHFFRPNQINFMFLGQMKGLDRVSRLAKITS